MVTFATVVVVFAAGPWSQFSSLAVDVLHSKIISDQAVVQQRRGPFVGPSAALERVNGIVELVAI